MPTGWQNMEGEVKEVEKRLAEWHKRNYPDGESVARMVQKFHESSARLTRAVLEKDAGAVFTTGGEVAAELAHLLRGAVGEAGSLAVALETAAVALEQAENRIHHVEGDW